MINSESLEMYLETVYLLEKISGYARSSDIAKHLTVSKPSVTKAMNKLKEKGLIVKETYGTITLTEKGIELSKNIYSKHRKITLFIENTLKLSSDEAVSNACKMEHILSEEMLEAIETYLYKNNLLARI